LWSRLLAPSVLPTNAALCASPWSAEIAPTTAARRPVPSVVTIRLSADVPRSSPLALRVVRCAPHTVSGEAPRRDAAHPYGKSRSQKPAYSYRELCRFPKVWDAPQGASGDPSIPEKTGISETMTGV